MNLADFFSARWLSLEIPYEQFEDLRLRCRTCFHRLREQGDYQVLRATRTELIGLGARVVCFPSHRGTPHPKWLLLLPLSTVNLERVQHHLFHELEHEWDHAFLGSAPVAVDDLAGGRIRTLPLTPWGALPRESPRG